MTTKSYIGKTFHATLDNNPPATWRVVGMPGEFHGWRLEHVNRFGETRLNDTWISTQDLETYLSRAE